MAFTTFVYDTLDVCTRLGRFIIQELTGWRGRGGRWFGTALTAGRAACSSCCGPHQRRGVPVWQLFWNLFGASNQLLAALTLLGVTVWLWRTRRARWVWIVTGVADGVHVRHEHVGAGHDDRAQVSHRDRRLGDAAPIRCRGSGLCC